MNRPGTDAAAAFIRFGCVMIVRAPNAVAGIGCAYSDVVPARREAPHEGGREPRDTPVGPGLLVVGRDVKHAQRPAHRGHRLGPDRQNQGAEPAGPAID